MRFGKIVVIAAVLAALPLASAFARGAGGFTWGEQYFDEQLSNLDLGASSTGVYGYNVTRGGQRYGGFAMAMHSDTTLPGFKGGFVGGIAGQEMRMGTLMAAVTLWSGFGGLGPSPLSPLSGTFALFAELSFEVGFGFFPGVMVTGYAGMQALAAVDAERAAIGNAMYTPVIGLRFAWGS